MAMPRVTSGTVPSSAAFNAVAEEIDNLGVACKVVRTSAQTGIAGTTDLVVVWQASVFDTRGDMWDPAFPTYITIQVPGTYVLVLQERFGITGGSNVGQRAGKIMLNGTSVFANSLASDKRAGNTDAGSEGTTLLMTAVARLYTGDQIYCNYWSSHSAQGGSTISALGTDYGGTYVSVARLAPIAI